VNRIFTAAFVAVGVIGASVSSLLGSTAPVGAAPAAPAQRADGAPDFDIRTTLPAGGSVRRWAPPAPAGLAVTRDPVQGTVSSMVRDGGSLTGAGPGRPEDIARAWLAANAGILGLGSGDLSGLVVTSQATTDHNGVTQLVFGQTDAGRPVYGSSMLFVIDREGRIVSFGGAYYPGTAAPSRPKLGAADAVAVAAVAVGASPRRALTPVGSQGPNRATTFTNAYAAPGLADPSPISASLVSFGMAPGQSPRLGWKTAVEVGDGQWYESVVDAASGELLYRRNYSQAAAEGTVYPCENPNTCGRQVVSFTGDPAFDNAGWVTDRTTSGNNANAYQDLDELNAPGYQPTTPASGDPAYQHFDYTFTNAFGAVPHTDVTTDRNAVVTQEFYFTNFMHDYLYRLGFTEAFRNFQIDNFGRGGAGNDAVRAEADDGFGTGTEKHCTAGTPPMPALCRNNANFTTPPDGNQPRMQMYLFTGTFRDGDMDASVVYHEYTHGLSNRLVGGGSLGSGAQTGGLGEGWSDAVAASILENPVIGAYVTGNSTTGVRRVAYDNSPLTYASLCGGGCEVHNDGEIWASALWDVRTALITRYGHDAGKRTHELLMVDGMKATPTTPSFLQARDGILVADFLDNGGANRCLIWKAFAGRGMGTGASSTDPAQMVVTTSTALPADCTTTTSLASAPNPTVFGEPVTFTATVAVGGGGGGTPTGTVHFRDGAVEIGTGALDAASPDRATFTTSALAVGTHHMTAVYDGDTSFTGSTSAVVDQVVTRAPTITSIVSAPDPSDLGQTVTFTATVAQAPPSVSPPTPPSGLVTFIIDGTSVAAKPLDGALPGHTTFLTAGLTPGHHTVKASYAGDANFLPSSGTGPDQVVTCTNNLTGNTGTLVLGAGSWCLDHVSSSGSVTIQPGAAVSLSATSVQTGITSTGASILQLCSVRVVQGPLTVQGSTGFVLVGDPADDHCGGNSIGGPATFNGNTGGLEVTSSSMMSLSVNTTQGIGAFPVDDPAAIVNNRVQGNLACSGNILAPVNRGRPNQVVGGTRSGQCGPGF